jgi:hypothetical protein
MLLLCLSLSHTLLVSVQQLSTSGRPQLWVDGQIVSRPLAVGMHTRACALLATLNILLHIDVVT